MREKLLYFFIGLIGATILYAFVILAIILVDVKLKDAKITKPQKIGKFICDVNGYKSTFENNVVIVSNNLYNITLNKKFTNEQSCSKISDIKIARLIDEYYIDENGNIYSLDNNELTIVDNLGKIPDYLFNEEVVAAYRYGASNEFKYFVLKDDGKIYKIKFKREYYFANGQGSYKFITLSHDEFMSYEGENIEAFKVVDDEIVYVKTNQNIYIKNLVDERCREYADIECKYDLIKNEKINLKDIKFIDYYGDEVKYIANNDKTYTLGV